MGGSMVVNRVSPGDPERREPREAAAEHYFVVITKWDSWCVSTAMARFVEECLDGRRRTDWIKFVDLAGARVRLRADEIVSVSESSPEQRAAYRAFSRRLRREGKADPDYDADED